MWGLCFRTNTPSVATVDIMEPLKPARLPADASPTDKGSEATMKSSPAHYISRIMVFTLCLNSMVFLGALTNIRTKMTENSQSAFEVTKGNLVFMIISICALFTAELASVILFSTNIQSNYYQVVKFIGLSTMNMAPWSLMLVLDNASKDSSMLFLISQFLVGITLAYASSGNDDLDKNIKRKSTISIFAHMGLVLVPLSFVLVLFVSQSYDWLVYSIIYSMVMTEAVCAVVIYTKVMLLEVIKCEKTASELIAQKVKNMDDLEAQKK